MVHRDKTDWFLTQKDTTLVGHVKLIHGPHAAEDHWLGSTGLQCKQIMTGFLQCKQDMTDFLLGKQFV